VGRGKSPTHELKKEYTMIGNIIFSQEELEKNKRREAARREGENFIKVINVGPIGINHIDDVEDILIDYALDPETGEPVVVKTQGDSVLSFEIDETGQRSAWVLDTERNRYFLARHLDYMVDPETKAKRPLLKIDDPKLAKEIERLKDKPWKTELSEVERLTREKEKIEKRLTQLRHQKEDIRKKARMTKEEFKIETQKEEADLDLYEGLGNNEIDLSNPTKGV